MKVSELLVNTRKKVNEHQLQRNTTPATPHHDLLSLLLAIEERLSWRTLAELLKISEVEFNDENLMPYVSFLAERWLRIKDFYPLTYTMKYKDPLTLTCVTLARELATVMYPSRKRHYYELLMPTINIHNDNLLMNLIEIDEMTEGNHIAKLRDKARNDLGILDPSPLPPDILDATRRDGMIAAEPEKIQLHHGFLDHWGNLINIEECILDSENDGLLKHPSSLITVLNQFGQIPGYIFRVMPNKKDNEYFEYERNIFYVDIKRDFFYFYTVGMKEPHLMTAQELNIPIRPLTLGLLDSHQAAIMEKAEFRGYITIQKQPRPLLPQEKHHILFHSKEAHRCYRAIINVLREKAKAYNAEDAISQLIIQLRDGGMNGNGGGTDSTSGIASYYGIRMFYHFTKSLSEENFEILMATNCLYTYWNCTETVLLKDLWCELLASSLDRHECNFSDKEKVDIKKLIEPHYLAIEAEHLFIKMENEKLEPIDKKWVRRPILCSEQFALRLEAIITEPGNAHLKSIIPVHYIGNKAKDKKRQQRFERKKSKAISCLNEAIRNNTLTHYSELDKKSFPLEVNILLTDTICLKKFSQLIASSIQNLIYLFVGIPKEYYADLIETKLGQKHLQSLFNTSQILISFFKVVAADCRLNLEMITKMILPTLGINFLQTIIKDQSSYRDLKIILPSVIFVKFFSNEPSWNKRRMDLGFLKPPEVKTQQVERENGNSSSLRRVVF
jgi:hypothetical protein